jgi:hypothetical protein
VAEVTPVVQDHLAQALGYHAWHQLYDLPALSGGVAAVA